MKTDRLSTIGAVVLSLVFLNGCDQSGTGAAAPNTAAPIAPPAATGSSTGSSTGSTAAPGALSGGAQAVASIKTLEPPPAPAVLDGPPRMLFASPVYNFGIIPETQKHDVRLGFTNAGGEALVISEVKTSCGCTAAQLMKRNYDPGESGYIKITYKPSAPGEQKQTVNVFTNGDAAPVRLTIEADVEAFIEIEPRMLRLSTLPYRQAYQTAVAVWSPDVNFRLDRVTTSNPHVSARVLAADEALRHNIAGAPPHAKIVEVTISPEAPWGGLVSWLDVTVSGRPAGGVGQITHNSKMRIMADMYGDLVATPNTVRFGVLPEEGFERKIRLNRPDGAPLVVTSAVVSAPAMPDANVEIVLVSVSEVELVFTATGPKIPRQYRGTVTVNTNVLGEEQVQIPIVGVVRSSPAGVR